MSVGGATWDTAGTLELGSGNTFDPADVTEVTGLSPYFNHAWWTFTPPVSRRYTLDLTGSLPPDSDSDLRAGVYVGDTEDEAHFPSGAFSDEFNGIAGTTYHILMATKDEDGNGVTEYRINLVAGDPLTVTPWMELADNANNEGLENNLIISRDGYDLQAANNRSDYQIWQSWMDDVIRRDGLPGRIGAWGATEVLGGEAPSAGVPCCWAHANYGEFGGQVWNTSGDPGDPSPGVCLPLGVTANDQQPNLGVSYTLLDGEPPDGFAARVAQAISAMSARAFYYLPVRDNTQPTGALFFPDPTADGAPDDAELEFEGAYVELLGVDFAGDNGGRPDESEFPVGIGVNDEIGPSYNPVSHEYGNWTVGFPGDWDGVGSGYKYATYEGGPTVDWVDLEVSVSGDDGWDSAADPEADAPDATSVLGMAVAWGDDDPDLVDGAESNADVALRFRLHSPRYRWIYPGAEPVAAIVRQYPNDALGLAAGRRIFPPPRTGRLVAGHR